MTKLDSVFASDLGWPPGQVLRRFHHAGQIFVLVRTERNGDGDVQCWDYCSERGDTLRVWND